MITMQLNKHLRGSTSSEKSELTKDYVCRYFTKNVWRKTTVDSEKLEIEMMQTNSKPSPGVHSQATPNLQRRFAQYVSTEGNAIKIGLRASLTFLLHQQKAIYTSHFSGVECNSSPRKLAEMDLTQRNNHTNSKIEHVAIMASMVYCNVLESNNTRDFCGLSIHSTRLKCNV